MTDKTPPPNAFIAADGKEWTFDIHVDSIEHVHAETNVSIYKLLDDKCKPLGELIDNMPVFAHVGYILVGASAAGVDRLTFAKSLKGDAFARMANAFLEELALFFPDARRRAAISKIAQTWKSFETQATEKANAALAKLDPDEVAKTILTKLLSTTSGDSPARQGFSPAKSAG